jgi:hypothetical protein
MLDRSDKAERRRAACERKRREREREKAGDARYVIIASQADVVEATLRSGALTEKQALSHAKVEQVLADVVAAWIARWRCHA